jgi:hypothetical protein
VNIKVKKRVHCITVISKTCLLLSFYFDDNPNTYTSHVQTLPDSRSSCVPAGPVGTGIECACGNKMLVY